MKKFLLLFLVLGMTVGARAQTPTQDTLYTPEQLDELLAPIALYPDPLIAIILPAAAAPTDIVRASQYLAGGGDSAAIDAQPWDESVKSLAHYPDVVTWMANNLDWTDSIGRAYVQQSTQVMQSIQQLRAQAVAAGTLVSTPQQTVDWEGNTIRIVPAEPNVIYVPQYDPGLVFVDEPVVYPSPVIFYGPPLIVGPWLYFECDWDDYGIWVGRWQPGWDYRRDWRGSRTSITVVGGGSGRFWRPDPVRQREVLAQTRRPIATLPQARPMPSAPKIEGHPSQGFHPATNGTTRSDVRGWPRNQPGAQPARPAAAPANRTAPAAQVSNDRPANRPAPAQAPAQTPQNPRPTSPVVREAAPAAPALVRPSPAPAVVSHPTSPPPTAPGPVFGGYTRGTDAAGFSNRGQASRQQAGILPAPRAEPVRAAPAAPPPAPAPREEPVHVQAPAPAPAQSSPPPSGGNSDQRRRS